jgi:hypothetical protein
MKTLVIRATLALALIAYATSAAAQNNPQIINIPISRPGEPISLEIGLTSARIEVIGEDREDAVFEVSIADGERKIVTPSGTQTLTGAGYALEVYEEDNEISLDTDWRVNKVTVLARIPRHADLDLSTINDGEIIVSNIVGNLELANTNGPITASGISGSVIAESVNDTIDISFVSIDDVNASSLETMNGDLVLGLPANASAQIHLDSAQGEITSDFEVEVMPTKPTVERDDSRGSVEVRIESVIVANINGGGPVVRLRSLQGDIHIRKTP